ncbi:K+-dependent Na+/Ca+ exchanger [Planktosalinus lacus]|uniref:K+-dependent Na+/Ca+ exchanger n=1 Tax=Planktosalinus lacus TaxID=1526573 RepID=A0A8J2V995_9FLAO|nr:K+-dependent Na+/Ca+ exchanger [Planktosalinus lacus]
MLNILLLLVGFVALIFGASKLVDAASGLAAKFGIPNIVIGLTIVAFGTSAPELVVNIIAAVNENTQMVLGNVLGSNIFNILGILGISAIIYPLAVKTNTTWYEIPLNLLAAIVVLVVSADIFLIGDGQNIISRSDAILLLLFFTVFLVYTIAVSKSEKTAEKTEVKQYKTVTAVFFIIIGLAGLIVGGQLIVSSATSIAQQIGLSERVIGLTIVSIGTSLPELATSIVAVKKKNVDIAIGNVVGSNIFNVFFVLGVSAFINPVSIAQNAFLDIVLNIVAGFILFVFVFTGKYRQIDRWEGIVFLMLYIAYLVWLIGF